MMHVNLKVIKPTKYLQIELKNIETCLNPTSIMLDFEIAVIKSISSLSKF
jgi:hypothetical protein